MLGLQGEFRCVLEEDGSEIVDEVLSAIFEDNEKVGVIMVLSAGEEWTPGVYTACMQVWDD